MCDPSRRYPLLGKDDTQPVKSKRAFTRQADQAIWDLGSPFSQRKRLPLRDSEFGANLTTGKYPFMQDHSGQLGEAKLTWTSEIQHLNLTLIVPDLIEGLSDKLPSYAKLAQAAIVDLLKHASLEKWIETIPAMTNAIKKVASLNNTEIARRILVTLKNLCRLQPGVGPDLAYYLHEILVDYNEYMEASHNLGDQIVYNIKLTDDLYDEVDELIRLLLQISGVEFETAQKNIKRAIPTYQIDREWFTS